MNLKAPALPGSPVIHGTGVLAPALMETCGLLHIISCSRAVRCPVVSQSLPRKLGAASQERASRRRGA